MVSERNVSVESPSLTAGDRLLVADCVSKRCLQHPSLPPSFAPRFKIKLERDSPRNQSANHDASRLAVKRR